MQMHANGAIGFERKYLLAPLQIPLTRLFESKSSAEPPRHHHPRMPKRSIARSGATVAM
jgi:hypothetical protein